MNLSNHAHLAESRVATVGGVFVVDWLRRLILVCLLETLRVKVRVLSNAGVKIRVHFIESGSMKLCLSATSI